MMLGCHAVPLYILWCYQAAIVLDIVCSFTLTNEKHVCSHVSDAEASACQPPVIHKEVGDAVEFSSCSSAEGISRKKWLHGNTRITDVTEEQFKGRLYFNPTNLSLTLSDLTVQDSGEFQFLSFDEHSRQRETTVVTLQVHGETRPQLYFYLFVFFLFVCLMYFH